MNPILINFLFCYFTVFSKPSDPSAKKGKEDADDYPLDDDYQYTDDIDENKSGQAIKENNSVHVYPPPYFETTEYNKTAKVGDNVVLECGAKNLYGKKNCFFNGVFGNL